MDSRSIAVVVATIAVMTQSSATQAQPSSRWSHQDWPTGHYKVVEGWPKPLPDTRHSHDGWTWGSFGGVYAESPDRIWVAMRGELPLPQGAAPWTPYGALNPSRGNSNGNSDGLTATCQPEAKRGWERRFEHTIIVFDRQGNLVDEWPHLDKLFSQLPCGRGPHQIKISPYDKEKHVWIIDDQLHMIYRFTYDGKLVPAAARRCGRGRTPTAGHRLATRRTYFITDGCGKRVVKYDASDNSSWISDVRPGIREPGRTSGIRSTALRRADRRLFVVDRGHARIRSDENGSSSICGRQVTEWPANQPPSS
jgi:hypothetical protein